MDGWTDAESPAPTTIPVFRSPTGEAAVLQAYREVIAAWPVPYVERMVPTSFGQTHVVVSGPAGSAPLVLLHAFMATSASWYRNVGALSDTHRVYCVDVVGDANLSRPTRPLASLEDHTRWFSELLDGLDVPAAHLVGNSFGAFTAAHLAMALPERVRSLVLIGPAATIHRMPAFYRNMFLPKALQLIAPWIPGVDRLIRRSVRWMHAGLPSDLLWEPLFRRTLLHGRPINRVFPTVFSAEQLAAIRGPVLVLLGARERIYDPVAAARAAARLLPDAQIDVVPEAHHITALSRPDIVNDRLLTFLGRAATDAVPVES